MSTELLPCPFCGDKAEIVRNFGRIGIACVQCNANFRSESICSETGYDSIFAAWNQRFVCLDKNGDKVFAGDIVWIETSVGLYKGVVTWRADHADWVVLEDGDSVGWGIRPEIIELVKEVK